ncbi:unnamed protein product [Closterium sp. Yama58-4]|nr:unnamed protein product [Closterium sp. Yama58-4]
MYDTSAPTSNESDIATWKKKDQKAFAPLISRIGINLVSSVRTCIKLEASAHEAWKRLEMTHVNKTLHGKILARNAFYTVKLHAGESMHEYATRVEELGETFVDLGGTVTEEDWILTLLCGLPEEWSTVITTLDSVQDTWTKETVVGRLLHEESRRRQFANESVETAMFSGGSSGGKSKWSKGATKKSYGGSDRGKGNTSNGASKCHYCGKAGHFWCRKRPSDWTPSKARDEEGNVHTASGEADDSKESLVLVAGNGNKTPNDVWFLYIGATQHMTHSASLLNNIGAPGDVMSIVFVNNESLPVVGVGSTRLIVDSGPKGVIATIDGANMNLFWKGKQFAQGVLNGELYQLKTHPRAASSNVAQGSKPTLKAWHNWLAHANYESVKELNKGLARGVDVITGDDEKGVCAACVEGKMARKPFGSRTSPLAKDPLALVHMDVCGPMRHASKGGARVLLPGNEWWEEASALAAWIRNRLPTKVLPGTTPFEAWTGTKPNLSRLRTFGCLRCYHLPDPLRHKLQPKARAAIYLGIVANERTWRVRDLGERRVVTSRDVVFDEDKFPTKEKPSQQVTFILPAREEVEESEVPPQVEKEAEDGGGENNKESVDDVVEVSPTETATTSTPSSLPLALARERREVRPHPQVQRLRYSSRWGDG